ncbi:hypothetical protein ACGFYV_12410 [Streptomyces sp. NPDC048297]|uniref:hypothetical protein n=1 Tax=Streptomyces sp. NPDC048297 TaxID=3365531 RepID=UPI00371AB00B
MKTPQTLKRTAVALGLATASVGLMLGNAGSASAASAYQLTLCSQGNYSAYADVPQQGGSTVLVAPGHCTTIGLSGNTTYANVRGKWNTNNGTFYIDTVPIKAYKGVQINTYGVTTGPYLWYSN